MTRKVVVGENKGHKVFLYALSTCGWCKKTKQFLKDNKIEYEYLDVDTASSENRRKAIDEIKARKVSLGFPIIIIDDETIISGYKPEAIAEALEL
jgi:glutaredoxin